MGFICMLQVRQHVWLCQLRLCPVDALDSLRIYMVAEAYSCTARYFYTLSGFFIHVSGLGMVVHAYRPADFYFIAGEHC